MWGIISLNFDNVLKFCLFNLILYVPSTIFQLNRDGSSWVEFISNVRQLFAADDFSRQHFQMHFFLGALRVKGITPLLRRVLVYTNARRCWVRTFPLEETTVLPAKSDSESCYVYKVIMYLKSIDHLCINLILGIGLIHK